MWLDRKQGLLDTRKARPVTFNTFVEWLSFGSDPNGDLEPTSVLASSGVVGLMTLKGHEETSI
jgi:hypothetical protein